MLGFLKHLYQGQMDFVGQRRAFFFQIAVIAVGTLIGFVYGFIHQRFLYTFQVSFAFTCLAALLVVPSWPCWNRHPVTWLDDTDAKNK